VARQANISGATVSRVLSGRTDLSISPETRAKVLDAARQLGYSPNSAARALTNGRTGIVGFWMSLEYSLYRGEVLDRMRTLLHGTDVAMAVSDVDEEYTSAHSFDRALRVPVDGILAFDNSASVEAFARESNRLAPMMPFVSMGAYWSESKSFVGIDLRAGADAAMAHLLSTGRTKIAYLAPWTSDLIDSGPRFEAYRDAMVGAGLEPRTVACERFVYRSIRETLVECASEGSMPEALFCMNDESALAASTILRDLGYRIGPDVAIVGFNGVEETEYSPVPLTTVRQPVEEMCALAWQFLQAQMEDVTAPLQQKVLVPELVIRESTQP
jgi:LacI family transcriptional regulator